MEIENKVEFCGSVEREGKTFLVFRLGDRAINVPSDAQTATHILAHLSKICPSPGRAVTWGNEEG